MPTSPATKWAGIGEIREGGRRFCAPCDSYGSQILRVAARRACCNADFKMDLGKIADAAKGAGLVFYCNPTNPTATYVGAKATRDFLAKVKRESPDTTILVDEAYFDYVTDPDHDTHIGLAVDNPRVVVARTKAYGMAGLRMGHAVWARGHDQEDARLGRRLRHELVVGPVF